MLYFRAMAAKRVSGVLLGVFLCRGPEAAAWSRPLTLASHVGPVAPVHARFLADLRFSGRPFLFSRGTTSGVVMICLSRGTGTLAIFSPDAQWTYVRHCLARFVLRRSTGKGRRLKGLRVVCLYGRIHLILCEVFHYPGPHLAIALRNDNMVSNDHVVGIFSSALFGTTGLGGFITRRVQVQYRPLLGLVGNVNHRVIPVLTVWVRRLRERAMFANDDNERFGVFLYQAVRVFHPIRTSLGVGGDQLMSLLAGRVCSRQAISASQWWYDCVRPGVLLVPVSGFSVTGVETCPLAAGRALGTFLCRGYNEWTGCFLRLRDRGLFVVAGLEGVVLVPTLIVMSVDNFFSYNISH